MTNHETFSVLVENRFGVLTRVAGLFSGRGYNIDSLTVSPTRNRDYSRMTIVTHGDSAILEQIEKQLNKLIEVVKVTRLTSEKFLSREMILLSVRSVPEIRPELEKVLRTIGALVLADASDSLTLQITGPTEELERSMQMLQPFGIIESARTGSVALTGAI